MSKAATRRPLGRPSEFTQETADAICEHIADGKSLRSYCNQEGAPSKSAVMKWLSERPTFADQYARAREMMADSHHDDIVDISDDKTIDPAHKRLMLDARKWSASKLAPRKYGERLELAGQVTVGRVSREPVGEDEWENQHAPKE